MKLPAKKNRTEFPDVILIRCKAGTKKVLDQRAKERNRMKLLGKTTWTRSDIARSAVTNFINDHIA